MATRLGWKLRCRYNTSGQAISYLTYRISPAAKSVDFERYALSGSSYVKNDEGSYVMGKLAISLAEGRTVSDITVAQVVITDDAGSSQTKTISSSILSAALSANGYVEASPGLFASISFNTGRNYTLTFTIGDAYDKAVFSVLVARSFANLHLSGLATGGVAIGKFSAATYGNPLWLEAALQLRVRISHCAVGEQDLRSGEQHAFQSRGGATVLRRGMR